VELKVTNGWDIRTHRDGIPMITGSGLDVCSGSFRRQRSRGIVGACLCVELPVIDGMRPVDPGVSAELW
jgi:hypothetical protein